MKRTTLIIAIAAVSIISARGQGFLNLNFESANNLPGNTGEHGMLVPITNALPDWTVGELSDIYYVSNSFPGASSLVELEGGSLALSGEFSVALFTGGLISQTAIVPTNAESLQFEAFGSPSLYVTLGGQQLTYWTLSEGPDYDYAVYGATIPAAMDGQIETLTFGIQGPAQSLLDNIEFSPMSIPEPSEWALVGLGMVGFALCHRRKHRRLHEHERVNFTPCA